MHSTTPRPLRILRLLLGLRQADLAHPAGVSRQLVSAVERGERKGRGRAARRVHEVLRVAARNAASEVIEAVRLAVDLDTAANGSSEGCEIAKSFRKGEASNG